jgi:1-acyl-sn-glycerol-3-phosphate acyltransferase
VLLLRSVAYDALIYGLMVVMGILFLPLTLTRDGTYRAIRIYTSTVLWLARVICGIRVEVRGRLPDADVLVCSKHQSFLDILILSRYLPRAKFVMKRELRFIPVFGLYAMRMGSTPVARGQKSKAMRSMVAHVESRSAASGQLVIYPQGTRVAPGAYLPYKIGAGVLYERLGLPCVLVATNAGVFWGRRKWTKRPGTAVMEVLETVPAGLAVKDFMARIEPAIESASDRLMREAGFDIDAVRATA